MAKQVINSIGINDDLTTVIRKTNDNFKRVITQQQQRIRSSVDTAVTNISIDATGEISSALSNALSELDAYQAQAKEELQEAIDVAVAQGVNDLKQQIEDMLANYQITDLLTNISELIYGASVVDYKIELPEGTMIPTGNINVYSAKDETNEHYLATHDPIEDPELDFDITI